MKREELTGVKTLNNKNSLSGEASCCGGCTVKSISVQSRKGNVSRCNYFPSSEYFRVFFCLIIISAGMFVRNKDVLAHDHLCCFVFEQYLEKELQQGKNVFDGGNNVRGYKFGTEVQDNISHMLLPSPPLPPFGQKKGGGG